MIFTRKFFKICGFLIVFLLLLNAFYFLINRSLLDEIAPKVLSTSNRKISWEDHDFINYEKTRTGPGENGQEWNVTDPEELKRNEEWQKKEGFFVEVSNRMSVTRALPDFRHEVCANKTYFEHLPNVSVVITFHNEIASTLLRCVHSILNRSPKKLIHEIVLVNDASTFPDLFEPLHKYSAEFFGDKVKIVENQKRQGLIKARMTGAKKATGEVLIFLDSHMEVYVSWLPPLLDQLVTHPKSATVPVVDGMHHATFRPGHTGHGYRGIFDWNFRYQWLPLRPQDRPQPAVPYELPSMTGGAYAIMREHFFYLGGYDEGLQIWNGENYELSLKLWLCSGGMYEIPCARVAHLSKMHSAYRNTEKPSDFIGRNLKRVAEVWLDDYKQYFYQNDPLRYKNLDAGDLSKLFAKKASLNCKPFSYYLDVVAPEMLERYPIVPTYFAAGSIISQADSMCLGAQDRYKKTGLILCDSIKGQDFILSLEKSIKYNDTNDQCLNSNSLAFSNCNHQGSGQFWKFDIDTRQIINNLKQCLSANSTDASVFLNDCDVEAVEQKWSWTHENKTALMNWDNFGVKIN